VLLGSIPHLVLIGVRLYKLHLIESSTNIINQEENAYLDHSKSLSALNVNLREFLNNYLSNSVNMLKFSGLDTQ